MISFPLVSFTVRASLVAQRERICLWSKRCRFDSWVGKTPGERNGNPLQYSLPRKPHRQRSLASYRPQGHKRVGHNLVTKRQQQSYCFTIRLLSFRRAGSKEKSSHYSCLTLRSSLHPSPRNDYTPDLISTTLSTVLFYSSWLIKTAFINTKNIMLRNMFSHIIDLLCLSHTSLIILKDLSHFGTTEKHPDSQTRCKASYSEWVFIHCLPYLSIIFSSEKQKQDSL